MAVYSHFKLWFNVTDYGAIGDGSADDTAAVNAAIAALNSAGKGNLYFPAGTYKCTSALTTITASGIVLGNGPAGFDGSTGSSMVLQTSSTANLFTVSGYRVSFANLGLRNSGGGTPSAGGGIVSSISTGLERVDLENVSVSRFYDDVDIQGTGWTIRNSWIFAPVRYGVRVRNTVLADAGDWTIGDCGIFSSAQNATSAIRIESSGGGRISGNKINMGVTGHKFATGIDLAIGAGNATSVLTVTGNSIENVTGDAISLAATSTGYYGLVAISALQVGLYSNNSGSVLNITAATNGSFATAGSVSVVTIDGVVAETDGTARAAISLTKSDKVTIGEMVINGFNARYTSSADTNTTDAGAATAAATLVSDKKTRTSGDVSFSGTSFAVIDTGLNITLTTGARRCLVSWTVVAKNSGTAPAPQQQVDVEIDGSRVGQTFGLTFQGGSTQNENANLSGTFVTDVLSAASHTFKLFFRVDGGTSTIYASTSVSPIVFSVVELYA